MNRIDQIFADLRNTFGGGGKALMPYLTAGDPDIVTTGRLIDAAAEAGAAVCEIGFPFSDPIADGPVIEASMTLALQQGLKVEQVLGMAAAARKRHPRLGMMAMLSYSIVYRWGLQRFMAKVKAAGFDGLILPDLPLEEAPAAAQAIKDQGLVLSMLIAPTSDDDRAARIAGQCSGFVYVLSRAGITGERAELPPQLSQRIEHLRRITKLPLAVGFGVSTAEHVRQVTAAADAAIVGSAVMRRVAEHRSQGPDRVVEDVRKFLSELVKGLERRA
ncbi:MAG: tryptophan synthase subunit alpha [Phycisphaeraceae bacterium]|nr:tryptophan synthase subunit alpha [Phycisphaeraceae bacterium]